MNSPETKRQRTLFESRLKNQKNAEERAKRYAEKFKNFINNTNVNHALVNSSDVNKIKNPVYLLSDVMRNKNGKVRHVYAKEYLDKTFKNKTIFRSPMTGLSTHPDLIKRYTKNAKNVNVSKFQSERTKLIKFFGKDVYEESLELDHMRLGFRTYHWEFINALMKGNTPFNKILITQVVNKLVPVAKKLKSIARMSYRDVRKISHIMSGFSIPWDRRDNRKMIPFYYIYAYAIMLYDLPRQFRNDLRHLLTQQTSLADYPHINHVMDVVHGRR